MTKRLFQPRSYHEEISYCCSCLSSKTSLRTSNDCFIFIGKPFCYIINLNKEIIDYFNAKKRQLSHQLENGDDPKKQSEETTIADDVFKEGLHKTDCLAIIMASIINVLMQFRNSVKQYFEGIRDQSKESRIKDAKQQQELNALCFAKNSMIMKKKESKINMEKRIHELEEKTDQQEQYFRCNCILIHGVTEII